jgi:hypothetical protein
MKPIQIVIATVVIAVCSGCMLVNYGMLPFDGSLLFVPLTLGILVYHGFIQGREEDGLRVHLLALGTCIAVLVRHWPITLEVTTQDMVVRIITAALATYSLIYLIGYFVRRKALH